LTTGVTLPPLRLIAGVAGRIPAAALYQQAAGRRLRSMLARDVAASALGAADKERLDLAVDRILSSFLGDPSEFNS